MTKKKLAPAVLIISCFLLAATSFLRLQSRPLQPPMTGFENPESMMGAPASPVIREEAVSSVLGQLEAFRHNDYDKAMYYQSPMMRVSVGNADQFRYMMVNDYPAFTNFTSVHIGEVQAMLSGQEVMVPISLSCKNKSTVNAAYMMARGEDGIYRVIGVTGGH